MASSYLLTTREPKGSSKQKGEELSPEFSEGALIEDSARFVIFCTLTWTKRERHTDYAASSMMFKGRKPSPDMVAWVQR
jgi:hypothetical protein